MTFQCDTGYMPQEEVISTCLSNSSWVPSPECEGMCILRLVGSVILIYFISVVDCGVPHHANRVVIDPFNNTKFGALITFHCEESNNSMTAVCGSDGEWIPDLSSYECDNGRYLYFSIILT